MHQAPEPDQADHAYQPMACRTHRVTSKAYPQQITPILQKPTKRIQQRRTE